MIDYSSSDDEDNDKVSMSKYNSLENKMHLLKMDNLNMKIENEEKSELMDKQLNPLKLLNDSVELNDLRVPPANRLEALKGSRKGQHSIRINDQWRICFRWDKGNASDVEIVDYH